MDWRFTQVEFGPHKVDVPEGGYYDRCSPSACCRETSSWRGMAVR